MHSINFDFQSRTKVIQGPGSAQRVGELAGALAAKRALLVTDAGLVAAGHATLVQDSLQKSGLHVTVFDQARENPTTKCVDECVVGARSAGVDVIIGLGASTDTPTRYACISLRRSMRCSGGRSTSVT